MWKLSQPQINLLATVSGVLSYVLFARSIFILKSTPAEKDWCRGDKRDNCLNKLFGWGQGKFQKLTGNRNVCASASFGLEAWSCLYRACAVTLGLIRLKLQGQFSYKNTAAAPELHGGQNEKQTPSTVWTLFWWLQISKTLSWYQMTERQWQNKTKSRCWRLKCYYSNYGRKSL